jgi:ankyrin repeat domain-containing protein 17
MDLSTPSFPWLKRCLVRQVNDEGYTPLMEASREGHEEMVALLLSQGADINAQTEETQETALTLACCGGFLEVADFLIKVRSILIPAH